MPFTLSGLGDEVDPDVDRQLRVLADAGLSHLELRAAEGTTVLDLDAGQRERVRDALDERGFEVSAIASPIGKVDVTEPFEPHFGRFETALERARAFDADYVRVFSYYLPEGDDPEQWRGEVIDRLERQTERAAEAGITLVHENERDIYGDTPARCRDLIEAVDSPHLRALFDPANFVVEGIEAYPDAYEELAEYVEYVHVKDATFAEGVDIEAAGEGDARVPEVLSALREDGYDGVLSLEPHLAGRERGLDGPAAFAYAAEALQGILDDIGADWA